MQRTTPPVVPPSTVGPCSVLGSTCVRPDSNLRGHVQNLATTLGTSERVLHLPLSPRTVPPVSNLLSCDVLPRLRPSQVPTLPRRESVFLVSGGAITRNASSSESGPVVSETGVRLPCVRGTQLPGQKMVSSLIL